MDWVGFLDLGDLRGPRSKVGVPEGNVKKKQPTLSFSLACLLQGFSPLIFPGKILPPGQRPLVWHELDVRPIARRHLYERSQARGLRVCISSQSPGRDAVAHRDFIWKTTEGEYGHL